MEQKGLSQCIQDVFLILLQLFDIEVFYALVVVKFGSDVLAVANLTHHWDIWTLVLNVVLQLTSGHVLELFPQTDVAAEFRAMELSMHLQIVQSLPHYERAAILWVPASVRELTDINTIGDNVV